MDITTANLVGDIKYSGIFDAMKFREFLSNLEDLMLTYKIQKIDVSWSKKFE